MIEKDLSGTSAAREVDAFYRKLFRPGEGHVWNAADLDLAADGRSLFFAGQCFAGDLEQGPTGAICRLDLGDGAIHQVARGRLFRNAPNGRTAYVEDGGEGHGRLVISSAAGGQAISIPLEVRAEALAWSPGGDDLLILAADPGADVSGVEGGFALDGAASGPSWLPQVTAPDAQNLWRRLYRWTDGGSALNPITQPPVNVWEAAWLGNDAFVIIASDHHSEGSWYEANLRVIDAETGAERSRHEPIDQIGLPVGAADGKNWAAIEAFCSDRGLVCGTIILEGPGGTRALDIGGVEASDICWRDQNRLLVAGLRESQTVIGEIDVTNGEWHEHWASDLLTIGGFYPKAVPAGEDAAFAVIEGYARPPAIARLSKAEMKVVAEFAQSSAPSIPGSIRYRKWRGRDGLEIGGWLVLPDGEASGLPLLLDIHGGPVWAHRNRYAAGMRAGPVLVARGYALFLPNPRGSGARGQDFARMVKGDMGGEDMHDYLTGIDSLVAEGIVDPSRIAVTGASYGGFMSAWLVTQTDRFAASVPISPVTNWYSQHFASQIPWFDESFLIGSPRQPDGQYYDRSPVFFAKSVTTPTLVLGGGRDKNTPVGQAVELYGALAEAGVETALAIYPEDGHSLRGYPAYLDSAARIVDWLERYIRT